MRTLLLAMALLGVLVGGAPAQPADSCPNCIIGLWIGSFGANFNFPGPYPIHTRLGYWSSEGAQVQALEFSITGLEGFMVSFEPPPGATLVGTLLAPSDTTGSDTGGMTITWDECQGPGDVTVMSIFFAPILPFPPIEDQVLWVRRRFPPAVEGTRGPTFTKCGASEPTAASSGCFVVNPGDHPDQMVDGCFYYAPLSVQPRAWSQVKVLFR